MATAGLWKSPSVTPNAFDGLGRDQCRKRQRIVGANTFRLVMAAVRTLWFIDQVEHGMMFTLCHYRPWYRQKVAPSQLDVVWRLS